VTDRDAFEREVGDFAQQLSEIMGHELTSEQVDEVRRFLASIESRFDDHWLKIRSGLTQEQIDALPRVNMWGRDDPMWGEPWVSPETLLAPDLRKAPDNPP
jgi:hypothetical protein